MSIEKLWKPFVKLLEQTSEVSSAGAFLRTHLPYPRQKILHMGKLKIITIKELL
jgi:hypothetical protein